MTAVPTDLAEQLSTVEGRAAIAGRLIGNLAHQLRGPLAAIANSVYCLEAAYQAEYAQAGEHLHRIKDQIATIERLLRHVTEFTQRPTGGRRHFAMQAVVGDAVAAARLPRRDSVHIAQPRAPVRVVADPDQIRRAITILLEFACGLLRESARLELALSATQECVRVDLRLSEANLTEAQVEKLLKTGSETPEGIDDPCLALALIYTAANGATLQVVPGEKGAITFRLCWARPETEDGLPGP